MPWINNPSFDNLDTYSPILNPEEWLDQLRWSIQSLDEQKNTRWSK